MCYLSDIGARDEIADVVYYLEEDKTAVTMLVDKAVDAQVRFSGGSWLNFLDCCGKNRYSTGNTLYFVEKWQSISKRKTPQTQYLRAFERI